jgi:hypothetical protein
MQLERNRRLEGLSFVEKMVARDGIESSTPAFSEQRSLNDRNIDNHHRQP